MWSVECKVWSVENKVYKTGWNVANVTATSSEHTLSPQTPGVKREPLLRIRERKNAGAQGQNANNINKIRGHKVR